MGRGMTQSNSIICDRAFELASRALKLCDRLYERGPSARHAANQLMRETTYWLRLVVKNGIAGADEIKWELNEARQLLAMIRSAILTARSSESRGSSAEM